MVGCLGAPLRTIDQEDTLNDEFVYRDGRGRNSTASQVARVFLYTLGDLATLFLSQLIFVPMEELALKAAKFRAIVDYERVDDGEWAVVRFTETKID